MTTRHYCVTSASAEGFLESFAQGAVNAKGTQSYITVYLQFWLIGVQRL